MYLTQGSRNKQDVHQSKKKKQHQHVSMTMSNDGKVNTSAADALGSTATPEGQRMAQALSTFHSLEQSRFEAFRRCTFSGDAIARFIAQSLIHINERKRQQRLVTRDGLGSKGYGVGASFTPSFMNQMNSHNNNHSTVDDSKGGSSKLTLKDLVVPNAAQEITVVVSTLAKAYAQRTVTQARSSIQKSYPDHLPLQPQHIQEAHNHRVQTGQDPGFFMQPPQKKMSHATSFNTDDTLQAALAWQDAYDLQTNKTNHNNNINNTEKRTSSEVDSKTNEVKMGEDTNKKETESKEEEKS